MREIVMLTGDNASVAADVARRLGISRWEAEALPQRKLDVVRGLQAAGHRVAVVGDGVNDSPALVEADIGIAVHGGTDVAQSAADVVIVQESLWAVVDVVDAARGAMRLIRQNWDIVFWPNALALGLTAGGVLGPIGATVVSNGSAVAAALNALRPLAGGNPFR
jgi:P-type E1-E2 ATPase